MVLGVAAIKAKLKDPYSAHIYVLRAPFKGVLERKNYNIDIVWAVAFSVNAKNSYGGYGGTKIWTVIYDQGRVRMAMEYEPDIVLSVY